MFDLWKNGLTQLPGASLHLGWSPSLSYGRHTGPPAYDARQAAVLVWLMPVLTGVGANREYHLPMITRPQQTGIHAGQRSLPGGALNEGESPEQAALRECREELGASPEESHIVGRLTPLYVYASNFWVTPVVAVCSRPENWHPNPQEVDEVFELPLRILESNSVETISQERWGIAMTCPCWTWDGRSIWGATAMVLAELAAVWKAIHVSPKIPPQPELVDRDPMSRRRMKADDE